MRGKKKILSAFSLAGLLIVLCTCAGTREGNPPSADTAGNSVTVTASFQQEDGTALSGGTVRISSETESVDRALDRDGQTRLSDLPRSGTFALAVFDRQEKTQGAMSLTFTEGAVIDAVTDESGSGHVTLRKDTDEIALVFSLKSDGTLRCALRLEEAEPSGTSQGGS